MSKPDMISFDTTAHITNMSARVSMQFDNPGSRSQRTRATSALAARGIKGLD